MKTISGWKPRGDSIPGLNRKQSTTDSHRARLSLHQHHDFSYHCLHLKYLHSSRPGKQANPPFFFSFLNQLRAVLGSKVLEVDSVGFHLCPESG